MKLARQKEALCQGAQSTFRNSGGKGDLCPSCLLLARQRGAQSAFRESGWKRRWTMKRFRRENGVSCEKEGSKGVSRERCLAGKASRGKGVCSSSFISRERRLAGKASHVQALEKVSGITAGQLSDAAWS